MANEAGHAEAQANANMAPVAAPPQVLSGLAGLPPFDTSGDITSLHQRWERWRDQFLIYTVAAGVANAAQKRALLLHMAGPDVQEIVTTLPDVGDTAETIITKLDGFFEVKKNVTKERQNFIAMNPKPGENFTSFVARLKGCARNCAFGADESDKQVRDRVLVYITDKNLKHQLISEQNLTLNKLLEVVAAWEDPQARQICGGME
jgi:hypothetical protein